MKPLSLITDSYERKARLYPALLVVIPVVVTGIAVVAKKLSSLESVGAAIVGCGGAFLLSQLARDAGKKGEKALFAKWGGLPSVAIFRHSDSRLDSITKARYHKKLSALVRGAKAPSVEEERADPAAADQVYTAWSTYLRVNARDTKKYFLLFQENVNYGYRRNVWGLRPIGIIATTLCCTIAAAWSYDLYRGTGKIRGEIIATLALALFFLLLWIFRFSSAWVRIPADAYAERLAETVETFGGKASAAKK
jgi:hypothetical protein